MKDKIPDTMYLLFEQDIFLGAFVERDAAERTKAARERAGFTISEVITYSRQE